MPKVITLSNKPPTLEEMQELVGGYVEHAKPLVPSDGVERQYFINEDGKSLSLEPNPQATDHLGYPIVGNLVILEGKAIWE